MSGLPYLPPEIINIIFSFVDDIDLKRHFHVQPHPIPRNDIRYSVLLNRPRIRQTVGKFHGGINEIYGEVVVKPHPCKTYFTVVCIRDKVIWSSYVWDPEHWNAHSQKRFYIS